MALSYRIYPADTQIAPQLVTSNVIDPNTILGLHQGRNGFANLIICIAEAWYLEKIRELTENRDNAIIDKWWTNYNASLIGQPWCEVFSAAIIGEAIKECGVTNLYPKSSDKVRIYKTSDNKIPSYNWELLDKEIRDNKLKQVQDVISANAFRASVYLIDNLRKYNVKVSSEPTPGSRFYRYSTGSGSSGHAGIVIAIKDGFFYTIEGNVYLDAQKLSQGVGMYRYPIAAAQNQATGFTFFDFSSYPSGMGNISCESKDFSYTYTGLDGKTKTRKCYKPPTPPKDVVDVPPPDKKDTPPPPKEEPKKDPCVPATGIFGANDTTVVKEKKCSEFLTVKIPDISKDGGLLQHFTRLKDKYVQADIVDSNQYYALPSAKNFTTNEILKRNGSALWYESDTQNTGKTTGFGMFKDRIGNIIYVLDANNPVSEQLALSGLLGTDFPTEIISINQQTGAKTFAEGWSLEKALWVLRERYNYFGIRQSQSTDQDILKMLKLEKGIANSSNGLYNSNGEWMLGEEPMHFLIDGKSNLGLDYSKIDNKYQYQISFNTWHEVINEAKYQTVKQKYSSGDRQQNGGLYNYVNIYNVLFEIEKNQYVLKNPIVICFSKPTPKTPVISQDFLNVVNIVGKMATMVTGIPLPLDSVIAGFTFAQKLEAGIKFNDINDIRTAAQFAHEFAKGVAPDFVKGIEKDVKNYIEQQADILKNTVGFEKDPNGQSRLSKMINDIGGEAKAYGKYFVNAKNGIDSFVNGQFDEAAKIIGLNSTQLGEINSYFDKIETGFNQVFDLRNIISGYNFKDVQKNYSNLRVEFATKTIINKLAGKSGYDFIQNIKIDNLVTNNALIQEVLINGGATNIISMFPKAPEFASTLLKSKTAYIAGNTPYQTLLQTKDKVKTLNEQRANIVASAFGYDLKICDIFAEETIESLFQQSKNYAQSQVPFFMPVGINPDISECYKFEVIKKLKNTNRTVEIINCPEGWNYDPKTNRCYNETTSVGYDGGGNFNFDGGGDFDLKIDVGVPKCIQSSFGTYVFYFRGIPLAAMKSTDGKWIAAWGGKNYFIDVDKCQLMGVPPETDKPSNEPPTPPAIPLPKCITIRNGKYYYNLRYAVGLSDGLISKELTDLFANTKTPIGGASPQDLLNYANAIGIDTSKVTNNPTVSSALDAVGKADKIIDNFNNANSGGIVGGTRVSLGPTTGSSNSGGIVGGTRVSLGPTANSSNAVTTAGNSLNPNFVITQAASEEEAYYMNGKWYLLRGGKYVEIIDCIPVAAKVYKCGIIERDGEFIFTKNGAEYKAVKNFDNDFYVFINGQYYQLDANCNPITPKPGTKECDECEKLVEVEKQNRIKLEKAFSESKVSNDSKIKELINLLNIQTQKSLELEKQIILRSGSSTTNNDSKYNELLTQLQNERERVNQLSKLIEQSKTGGNNNDSVIREIIISLNQEKERSQKLEQKISELEQMKSDNSSSSDSREYFNNLDNISKEKSFEKDYSEKQKSETLPNCITLENGKYYFTGMVQNDTLKLIALNTAKGWVASYQSSYYMIDLANCKLLTGNLRGETNITGECTDCVQNTQPRIVERSEKIVYGGFKQGLDPEVYEDCDDCE